MTRITITRRSKRIVRIEAEGHSGYADAGADIVCAGVTACVRLVSAQLEAAEVAYEAEVDESRTYLSISADHSDATAIFAGFDALMRQLRDEFPENITITEVEQNA